MTCRTCRHPQRSEIDRALASGESTRGVAGRFGLPKSGVDRHARLHLKPSLANQLETLSQAHRSIVPHLLKLRDQAVAILSAAMADDDRRSALQAIREVRGVLETMGHASGELLPAQVQQVYLSLGVSDESELRRIIAERRAMDSLTLDDAERDAVETLKLVFEERPERREPVLAALSSQATVLAEGADELAVGE